MSSYVGNQLVHHLGQVFLTLGCTHLVGMGYSLALGASQIILSRQDFLLDQGSLDVFLDQRSSTCSSTPTIQSLPQIERNLGSDTSCHGLTTLARAARQEPDCRKPSNHRKAWKGLRKRVYKECLRIKKSRNSHHEGEIIRLPLPLPPPLEFLRRRCSRRCLCAAAVARSPPSPDLRRRCSRRCLCAVARSPPSPDLRRRSAVAAVVARSAAVVASFAAAVARPAPSVAFFLLRRLLVMAEEIVPKTDVALDAGIAPKSENLPFQVTPIRLTKDNYLSWSAALEIGITSRGRLPYITGDKPAPSKTDPQWANWALEDSQVKVWIISSVSADIQPLILRKPTSFEMWNVLARMYGRKKRVLRTYQIKRNIYALKQGDLSVASYYAALKTKWEELDYHVEDNWDCGSDHARHWEKEWMDRTFLFLGGLRDEFESIRSQILNCDEIPGIEDVYARVESEEQRRQVMQIDPSRGSGPSAFVSRSSVPGQRPARRCTHCNKPGHSVDFCWDLHPEKRLVRGRPPSSRRGPLVQESNQGGSSSSDRSKLSQDQIKELQAYIGRLSTTSEDSSASDGAKLAQALVATSDKDWPEGNSLRAA
ncbi:hypothetical protein EJ110_NYTH27258 [Nymphaea thermarum]|nr:hypothetical protein EJ110_NYTH27258 [Nymphaea thermarum]